MRRGITLLELVIVLTLVSLIAIVALPGMISFSTAGEEGFRNRLMSLFVSSFSPGSFPEVCVDFEKNLVSVDGVEVKFPAGKELVSLVMPGKLVSRELRSRFCFSEKKPTVVGLIAKKAGGYYVVEVLFPVGEVNIINLSESEAETFKDKISKGRLTEWFSYYSY